MDFDEEPEASGEGAEQEEVATVVLMDDTSTGVYMGVAVHDIIARERTARSFCCFRPSTTVSNGNCADEA